MDVGVRANTIPRGHRVAAGVLTLVAGMYVVGLTQVAPLVGAMARGWILNPDAHVWWRITSLYAVLDFLWMPVGILLCLTCAVAIVRGKRWASTLALGAAGIGIAFRVLASGGHLFVWLLWDRSEMSANMRLELALTGAIVLAYTSVIYLLRGGQGGMKEVVVHGRPARREAG